MLTIYQHDREYPGKLTRNEVLICNSKTRVEEVGFILNVLYVICIFSVAASH